jgi:hypothetical protein
MSSSTQCNFCGLERVKGEAKKKKWKVTIIPGSNRFKGMDGLDVYMHPRTVNIHTLRSKGREFYFVSWMWAIGSRCEC